MVGFAALTLPYALYRQPGFRSPGKRNARTREERTHVFPNIPGTAFGLTRATRYSLMHPATGHAPYGLAHRRVKSTLPPVFRCFLWAALLQNH